MLEFGVMVTICVFAMMIFVMPARDNPPRLPKPRVDEKKPLGKQQRVRRLADELDMTVQGNTILVGSHNGFGVRLSEDGEPGTVRVRCTLKSALPEEISSYEPDEDDYPLEVADILATPAVRSQLDAFIERKASVALREDRLLVTSTGDYLKEAEQALGAATRLAQALHVACEGRWIDLAVRHRLKVRGDVMKGKIDGVQMRIELLKAPRRTQITADLPASLPAKTKIAHAALKAGDAKLGDPIMDSMLSIQTSDADALAALLCNDRARGALLQIVHGFEGSVVTSNRIRLEAPGRLLAQLDDAVLAVVELVKATDQ